MVSQPKRLQRTANRDLAPEEVPTFVKQYLAEKEFAEDATKRVNAKKAVLSDFIDKHGYVDDKGSRYVDVPGLDGVSAMKRERRVTTALDRDKVEAWLKKKGWWERFSIEVRVLDEDALVAAGYEDEIPARTMAGFYTEQEVFALKSVK